MIKSLLLILLTSSFLTCSSNVDNNNKTIELSFGHDMPENTPQHYGAVRFADIVSFKSKGRIKIKIYPAQKLGTDQQMIQRASRGEIDFILPPAAKSKSIHEEIPLLDLPYLFDRKDNIYDLLDGQILKYFKNKISKKSSKNLILLSIWESGFKQITSNIKIDKLLDFKKLKIRVMENLILQKVYQKFGSRVYTIDFHRIKDALKNNDIDAQENPINSIASMGFHNHQKYLYLTNHSYLSQLLFVSASTFKKLNPNDQQIIIHAAKEATGHQRNLVQKIEKENLKRFETKIKILTMDKKLNEILKKQFFDNYHDVRIKYSDFFNIVNQNNQDDILLGLDVSLTGGGKSAGIAIKRGVEMALDEINNSGGVLNKKIQMIVRDNSGFPAQGKKNIEYFKTKNRLIAVMGGMHSSVALNQLKDIHENKIILLIPWAAATEITSNNYNPNYVFRYSVRDELVGGFLINHALKKHKNICLVMEKTHWGRSNLKSMTESLNNRNMKPVYIGNFLWGQKDFSELIQNLEKNSCEAVMFVGNSPEGINFFEQLATKNTNFHIYSHWGILSSAFYRQTKSFISKLNLKFLYTFSFSRKSIPQNAKDFFEKYKIRYDDLQNNQITSEVGTIHAYELTHILVKAIKLANSLDTSKIRNALEQLTNHKGLFKNSPKVFNNNHEGLNARDYFLCQYINLGHISCEK